VAAPRITHRARHVHLRQASSGERASHRYRRRASHSSRMVRNCGTSSFAAVVMSACARAEFAGKRRDGA
jgi:hypothetical protein